MASLQRAVKELQSERSHLEKELERVNAALSALASLNSRSRGRGRRRTAERRTVRPQRHMSASARRRIAAAQRARWAKLRQERVKKAAERWYQRNGPESDRIRALFYWDMKLGSAWLRDKGLLAAP